MKLKHLIHLNIILLSLALGQAQQDARIVYSEKTSLRLLAEKYFNAPNDWEIILRYNGYQSPNDISIGASLLIPVNQYKQIESQLKSYAKYISKANTEGAILLASSSVENANQIYSMALNEKKTGTLNKTLELARQANAAAKKAYEITKGKRTQSISAKLKDKDGKVQSRKKNNTSWAETRKDQELFEKENVRTLKDATGLIAFVDGSHITMGENALVVIEHSKQDVINRTSRSDVMILEGDASTYLKSSSGRNRMNIKLPGVQTKIRSSKFWVSRDEKEVVRLANFDGELDVFTRAGSVTIKKNEGSKIEPGKAPEKPKKLLPSPLMNEPKSGELTFQKRVNFKWSNVPNSKNYKIQIAEDPKFLTIIAERFPKRNSYQWTFKRQGKYSVRVSSVNDDDMPGDFSAITQFTLLVDDVPPYASIQYPFDGYISYSKHVKVKGEIELGTTALLNGKSVNADPNGRFQTELTLSTGKQTIELSVTDRAGNVSKVKNEIIVLDQKTMLNTKDEHIVTNKPEIVLKEFVKPFTEYRVKNEHIYASTSELNYIVKSTDRNVSVIDASDTKNTKKISIRYDDKKPMISLADFPEYTRDQTIKLKGEIDKAASVFVNGKAIPLDNMSFSYDAVLHEGKNNFVFTVRDNSGNIDTKKVAIYKDTKKPRITSHSITKVDQGYFISVDVDGTGSPVSRACQLEISIEKTRTVYTAYWNEKSNRYELTIPSKSKPKMHTIEVTDYSMNNLRVNI